MAEQHEKALVPQIRFTGFTDPWEQRKLSDLTDRVSIQSSDSDLPQVEYEDIIPGEGTLNKDLRDKKGGKTGIKFYAGDVLYGKLRPYLMNWLYPQFNGVAVGDFWVLRATECDSSFLYRLVQTGSFQRLANVSSGSKMPRADWNLISQSFFAVPADHAEQKAIAKGLAELDTLITLHQRKYDKLCVLKKSMLDKMFPKGGSLYPEIRFAGFTDPWEQRKLSSTCEQLSRTINPLETPNEEFTEYSMPAFDNNETAETVIGNSMNSLRKIVDRPCLLVNKLNVRKKRIWHVPRPEANAVCSSEFVPFSSHSSDLSFIKISLLSERITAYLESCSSGSSNSQKRVTPEIIMSSEIIAPSLAEQRRIGAFFDRLDSLITLHQRKLELLRNIKKSMLDKMFV
ncbi:restriction endonuclease subunit S [Bifidobacterium adolescentis]